MYVTPSRSSTPGVLSVPELAESEVDAGVVARFRRVVTAGPDRIAVSDEREEITYAQLAARAAVVAASVRARGLPAGQPVAMVGGHDGDAVAMLLGVVASGHPVLVVDARAPARRLQSLAERVDVGGVVADAAHEELAAQVGAPVTVPLRDAAPVDADVLWEAPPDPRSVAALAFTSGSTGSPKPVANDHVLFVRDAWNSSLATGCYDSTHVIAHTLPISFHAGLTTTIHGLVVGATMRLYDARNRGIAGLPAFIGEHRCTVMITSPAILRALTASAPDPETLASLTSVTVAGESAYGRDIEGIRPFLPPTCVVRNRYGSSETGLISEFVVSADPGRLPDSGALPVGVGVGRTVLGLLADADGSGDADGGATGRITVTAPSVAVGYHGMPDETAAAFRDNADGTRTYLTSDRGRFLPDGSLRIVGRVDHSVKVRGYLVDPGEVDAALFALPRVREAVVLGVPRSEGGARLVAYVVPADPSLGADDVRLALRQSLPLHMVPEVVVFLDALPRSERGKIDRLKLPEPIESEGVVPHQSMSRFEELVAMLWMFVLKVDRVGPNDDFFALGGDSLAAEALLAAVSHDLGIPANRLHTGLLAEAPVLRDFAARIGPTVSKPHRSLVTLQASGDKAPLFIVAGAGGLGMAHMGLARRIGASRPVHALQSPVIEARGLPERSVEQIARRNVAIVRSLQPNGPYHLAGHSFGGIIAFEMAQKLTSLGEEVALLAILDSFPPDPSTHPARDKGILRFLRHKVMLYLTTLRTTRGGKGHLRLHAQSKDLARRYRGRPYAGRTVVFLAQSDEKEQRRAWDPFLTGEWRLVEVQGDHQSMNRTPWVDVLADTLEEEFAQVESRS